MKRPKSIRIRKARMGDVKAMHQLLNSFADKRELLPRSISEVYENLQQFYVAEHKGRLIGTCALYVTWDNLAEVKALAVDEKFQGQGIGKRCSWTRSRKSPKTCTSAVFSR